MQRPFLIVVSGPPASGKTTLAHLLAREIHCPVISRDELKEGYVTTSGKSHAQLQREVDLHIYETFFQTIELLLSRSISVVAEAAFQNKLWKPKLTELALGADIKIIRCSAAGGVARQRFLQRVAANPNRERFHGDQIHALELDRNAGKDLPFDPIGMNVPTLEVDTTGGYQPAFQTILQFILQKDNQLS
jgi:predicted kinase